MSCYHCCRNQWSSSVSDNINISTLWISIYFIHSLYTYINPNTTIWLNRKTYTLHKIYKTFRFVRLAWTEQKNRHPISDYHYSELTILRTNRENSGNYSCVASNAQPAFVLVHIFKGKYYIDIYTKCSNTTQWIELNRIKCGIRIHASHTHVHTNFLLVSLFRSHEIQMILPSYIFMVCFAIFLLDFRQKRKIFSYLYNMPLEKVCGVGGIAGIGGKRMSL